mmetsp:Transcript_55384/g.166009  ORF Transcript_55384/g.166009 Transcript_55384/m.166009 type:complete len:115 (+) Transcript_55384:2233-2577(+)
MVMKAFNRRLSCLSSMYKWQQERRLRSSSSLFLQISLSGGERILTRETPVRGLPSETQRGMTNGKLLLSSSSAQVDYKMISGKSYELSELATWPDCGSVIILCCLVLTISTLTE